MFLCGSRLGLRIIVCRGLSSPEGTLCFPCKKAPAPAWMRVEILIVYSCPHHHHSIALKIQLLYRAGSAGFAVGRQHRGPRGSYPPTHASHRAPRLFKPKFLIGAQPSLDCNLRGLGSLWRLLKSRLAETLRSETSRKKGLLPQPRCQAVPARDPPSRPARAAGFPSGEQARDRHGAGTRQPSDRGTCGAEGSDPPPDKSRAIQIPSIRKSFCTTT